MIISTDYWKTLVTANRELALRFEKLQKAHASGDPHGIKMAEIDYLQTLQCLYTAAEQAVAAQQHPKTGTRPIDEFVAETVSL